MRSVNRYQLQMQNSVFNFLGSSLIPILGADVAASTTGNIHLALVGVAALGADPNQLAVVLTNLNFAVVATLLAEIGLGIQLRVHDVFVNELHQLQHRVDVLLHVGHFHIGNGATGRQLLELSLEG